MRSINILIEMYDCIYIADIYNSVKVSIAPSNIQSWNETELADYYS